MKNAISKELICSAVCGGIGFVFFYRAACGLDRNVFPIVLWHLSCGFGAIAVAAQPGLLFERVGVKGLAPALPMARGMASLFNVLSLTCLAFTALAWLLKLYAW